MNREVARVLIEELTRADISSQKIDTLISNIKGSEKEKLIQMLGQLAGNHFEILEHVINQFPEFDPEGEGKDLYKELKELHV